MLLVLICSGVVSIAVLIHYIFLHRATGWLQHSVIPHHFRIIFVVLSSLLAHLSEITLFAIVYYFLQRSQPDGWGHLAGDYSGTFLDSIYYSAITYTTLGFGDITPVGNVRIVTALEALLGLILIAWTATFIYNHLDE
ncbi:MAG: two pore domain potassium channel family protein [Gammaproteobacteria bacterium]|nr:two pore domain potassium channel family protein [Gammaproteobacteria bacterium]